MQKDISINQTQTLSRKIAYGLERRSGPFIGVICLITIMLAIPMVTMVPKDRASEVPGGIVYDLEDLVNENLPQRIYTPAYLIEAVGRDVFTKAPLLEIYNNSEALRRADALGELAPPNLAKQPLLHTFFDPNLQRSITGLYTIADVVQDVLMSPLLHTNLQNASDDQIKIALHHIFREPRNHDLLNLVSIKREVSRRTVLGEEIDYWVSPGFTLITVADNEKLGGGALKIGTSSDPVTIGKEQFNRKVQSILRGEQSAYRLWGIVIDASLEIQDEVGTAVPFIIATFFMVLVVIGIMFRSIRVVGLTAIGLVSMIIWLKGISNLIGLNSSSTLDFVVPIAMISLGADFAIHALSRYREERRLGLNAPRSFVVGMTGVLGALSLAMLTDSVAFLANASAETETVIGFGIGAALATFGAFIILGVTLPLVMMRLDAWKEGDVLTPVSEDNEIWLTNGQSMDEGFLTRIHVSAIVGLAKFRFVAPVLTIVITLPLAYYAFQLDASFNVEDFLKADSDVAVSVAKLDEHIGESSGEPAIIYIEGDLSDPGALLAIQEFIENVADNPYVAKNSYGEATIQARTIFNVLDTVVRSEYARLQIQKLTGVPIAVSETFAEFTYGGQTYLRPESQEQLRAIYDYIVSQGVPLTPDINIYESADVRETLFHESSGANEDATRLVIGIPGTSGQDKVVLSRENFVEDIHVLGTSTSITLAGLTGSPYTRQAALDATTQSLQRAFLIAVFLCLVVTVAVMRSVLFGVVTIIPIGVVVVWIYAFMYFFGFGLNFVTATIAAISIGVGVDYSIHMTQRFREEMSKTSDHVQALRLTVQGTGMALMTSASTSVVGFCVMAFAPMPMFSAYGVLTAVMIIMAAIAALGVLPSLLLLVSAKRS